MISIQKHFGSLSVILASIAGGLQMAPVLAMNITGTVTFHAVNPLRGHLKGLQVDLDASHVSSNRSGFGYSLSSGSSISLMSVIPLNRNTLSFDRTSAASYLLKGDQWEMVDSLSNSVSIHFTQGLNRSSNTVQEIRTVEGALAGENIEGFFVPDGTYQNLSVAGYQSRGSIRSGDVSKAFMFGTTPVKSNGWISNNIISKGGNSTSIEFLFGSLLVKGDITHTTQSAKGKFGGMNIVHPLATMGTFNISVSRSDGRDMSYSQDDTEMRRLLAFVQLHLSDWVPEPTGNRSMIDSILNVFSGS